MNSEDQTTPGFPPDSIALSVEEIFDIALKLHQGGNLDSAEMLYGRILEKVPDHLNSLHFYGLLCHQQQRRQEAVSHLGRIIEIDPQNADAHNNLGNVLEGMGRVPDAETCYRNAIALNPAHAPALNNLGVVLMARKAVDEALDVYVKAVELSPETADYRYNLANALRKGRRIDDALADYRKAVALDPTHVGAWQGLSRTLIKANRRDEAVQVFDAWLEKDPGNPTALYLQAACKGESAPDRAPDAYVQKIFDGMADSFDRHLQDNLDYRAPQLLMDALAAIIPTPEGLLDILDAGCGTGLCGPLFKPYARKLVGVDLSAGMLTQAKAVNAYDELVQAELTQYLKSRREAYDVIVSADTLCYFGDLEKILRAAALALKSGGLLAFSLEDAGPKAQNWLLNTHGRYAHTSVYIHQVIEDTGLTVKIVTPETLRKEGGVPVNGHLVVATS